MEFLAAILEAIPDILKGLTIIVAGANVITAATPSTFDNAILNKLAAVLNILSINFGKNRNADDKS